MDVRRVATKVQAMDAEASATITSVRSDVLSLEERLAVMDSESATQAAAVPARIA